MFTALVMVSAIPGGIYMDVGIQKLYHTTISFNWAFVYVCLTGIYYIILEPMAGVCINDFILYFILYCINNLVTILYSLLSFV